MARAVRSGDDHETGSEAEPASEADLYQVDPGQFTSARNALAKRMRTDSRPDEAARIGKLRRPPVTAWALNQLSRRRPDLIGAVLDTGGHLRSAMEKAVAGDASGLRDAQAGQRRAVDAAVAAAAEGLEAAGHPGHDAARQRMAATLGAAVVDTEVAQQLRDGLLDGDRSAPGFGLDGISMRQRPSTPRARAGTVPLGHATETRGTDQRAVGGGRGRPPRESGGDRGRPSRGAGGGSGRPPREPGGDRPRRAEQAAERERRRQAQARHAELEADAARLAHRAERLQARAEEAQRRAADARAAAQAGKKEADEARRRAEQARP